MDGNRGYRNQRRRGKNWSGTVDRGPRFGEGGRQTGKGPRGSASPFFLPQHLRRSNPWDDADRGDCENSRASYNQYTDDFPSNTRNSSRRYNDNGSSNAQYNSYDRNTYDDYGELDDNYGRNQRYEREYTNRSYQNYNHGDRRSGNQNSRDQRSFYNRDRDYNARKQSRGNYFSNDYREISREEVEERRRKWLREQERLEKEQHCVYDLSENRSYAKNSMRSGGGRRDGSYGDYRERSWQPSFSNAREQRQSFGNSHYNQNYGERETALKGGCQRRGRWTENDVSDGNHERRNNARQDPNFSRRNDGNRNHSSNRDMDKSKVDATEIHSESEQAPMQGTVLHDKSHLRNNGSEPSSKTEDDLCNALEDASVQDSPLDNSDTESDCDLKTRPEQDSTLTKASGSSNLPSSGSTVPAAASSSSLPPSSSAARAASSAPVVPKEEPGAVVLAPKKEPASRQGKERVHLLTNFWELTVNSKIVYRYDVAVYLNTPAKERVVDLLKGPRDDFENTRRHRLCMEALKYALQLYRIVSQYSAFVHDGASILFSSEDLSAALKEHSGVLNVMKSQLPESIRNLICRVDVDSITIEITPCQTAAASFDLADLSAQKNRNWATLDRSWKQFYELITNYDAVLSGKFTQFGAGSLFSSTPLQERVGFGFERFEGARKGIKFIEGRKRDANSVVPALILDHRVGMFFKEQNLMRSVQEMLGPRARHMEKFDFSRNNNNNRMNKTWMEVNNYVKGLRVNLITDTNPLSIVAIGISERPLGELEDALGDRKRTETKVLTKNKKTVSGVRFNPDWPAVKYRNNGRVQYFPMEVLIVAPNQRVSLEKQQIANSVPRADRPDIRYEKIHTLLEALNLHDSGDMNNFLKAFGVKVAMAPKEVDGIRRAAPGVVYGRHYAPAIDGLKYNWSQNRDTKYANSASVERIIIVHSDYKHQEPKELKAALEPMYRSRGIQYKSLEEVYIQRGRDEDMEKELEELFKKNKGSKSLLIIYIDRAESKSHEFLKLMERKHLIPTQQITSEIVSKIRKQSQTCSNFVSKTNLKLGGINHTVIPEAFAKNRWIACGTTLVVGYDVAHPGKPTRDEIMNHMPPQRPSIVGFSFNGAAHPESFIGDYHFQNPRQERVDSALLNARFKWMLDLFTKNRQVWPERIVITRDGVSEGQYRMVVEDELGAIKEACEEFGNLHGRESWTPPFTVIVATKRHHARFFKEHRGVVGNPLPATVVDTDVVRNDITEFFMQSHRPVQGTAKPTSYQVIVDENEMGSDEVQSLMLALTFHHQISDAPVSLPEPVYQADEWAKRGKDIWKAYTDRHDLLTLDSKGDYADFPVDFEAMTKRLAYWGTNLQCYRVNA